MKPEKFVLLALAIGLGSPTTRAETSETPVPVSAIVQPAAPTAPAAPQASAKLSQPVREVVKMAVSGISDDVLKAYIDSSSSTFNLTPDAIIHLQGVGVSGPVITAMLSHDKVLIDKASTFPPPNQMPAGAQPAVAPATAPYVDPGAQVDYGTAPPAPNYYYSDYNELAPYGSWYYVGGTGWCWQPYSWLGYYSYPWGLNTFGYGRWWHHPERGWCWSPNGFRGAHVAFNGSHGFIGGQSRGFSSGQTFGMPHATGFSSPSHGFSTFNHGATGSSFGSSNHGSTGSSFGGWNHGTTGSGSGSWNHGGSQGFHH